MLRKFLLQNRKTINGTNKRTFSSLTKRQVLKQNGKPHNAESSKRFYSSTGSSGNGTKLNSTILNYPTEDVLSIGLSILALKFAYDFVYGEKKKEEEPKVEEPKIDHNKEDSKLEEPKVGEEAKEVSEIESIEAKADFEENPTEEPKAEEADSAESEKAASEETAAEAEPVKGDEETKAESSNEDSEESKDTPSADAISEGAIDASAAGPAYNPETGEINWDCPCLGGMAHGPCGEEFKDAFSCFIYSEAEPKGVDCIEKFQGMQECFKKHPEIYAEQLKDEEAGAVPATSDEDAAATLAGEEVVSVDVIEEVINEQVVPVVDEIVTEEIIPVVEEKIVPVVEEKIVPAVEKIVDANITPASEDAVVFEEPETIDELVEEGLPINAED